MSRVFTSLDAIAAACADVHNSNKGMAYGLQIVYNVDEDSKTKPCAFSQDRRVKVVAFQQTDTVDNGPTRAAMQLCGRLQELLDAQAVEFWEDFEKVLDRSTASACMANKAAKNAIFAAFMRLLRLAPCDGLVREARVADRSTGGGCCSAEFTPSDAALQDINELPCRLPLVFLFDNAKPSNDPDRICMHGRTSMPMMNLLVLRFRAVYVPTQSDLKNMGAAATAKDPSEGDESELPHKRQKKQHKTGGKNTEVEDGEQALRDVAAFIKQDKKDRAKTPPVTPRSKNNYVDLVTPTRVNYVNLLTP